MTEPEDPTQHGELYDSFGPDRWSDEGEDADDEANLDLSFDGPDCVPPVELTTIPSGREMRWS